MTINSPSTNSPHHRHLGRETHVAGRVVVWGERMQQSPRRVPAMEDAGAEEKDGASDEFFFSGQGWGKSLLICYIAIENSP